MKNQNLKSLLLMLAMLCISIGASAYSFEVDGICYNILSSEDNTCAVIYNSTSKYSGSVDIPSSVTYNSVEYSVTSIGDGAFCACSGLTSVTIPNSVTSIGIGAFEFCSGLTEVNIPNSVTSIGSWAFNDCSGLTSITIPNSVTSIGNSAFSSCSGLTSITIPNSVTSIGSYAFYGCTGLASFTVDSSNPNYCSENNILYSKDKSELTYCMTSYSGSITIPNSVTSIGDSAFRGCTGLREIHSNNITPPTCDASTFKSVKTANCKLYVPIGTKEDYMFADGWGNFENIIEETVIDTSSDIAKPTICYVDKQLQFSCSTPGVTYSYTINAEDNVSSLVDSETGIVNLSATYIVTAYAKKDGKTSEPATATLVWVDAQLTTDGESTEVQTVKARPVLNNSNCGNVTISGLNDNEIVDVYSLSGSKIGSATSAFGSTSFNSIPNEAIIVKVGDRSVKVAVK